MPDGDYPSVMYFNIYFINTDWAKGILLLNIIIANVAIANDYIILLL